MTTFRGRLRQFASTGIALTMAAVLAGCATAPRDELEPTKVDKAVMRLLGAKRPSKQVRAALKKIRRYAAPPARVVETFKDDSGVTHTETEMMYPRLGIKVFLYDGVFSGADSIQDYERPPSD